MATTFTMLEPSDIQSEKGGFTTEEHVHSISEKVRRESVQIEEPSTPSSTNNLRYHAYTIWLFTRRDLETVMYPQTAFGVFSALSGPLLTTNPSPKFFFILSRLPQTLLWNWMNLLLFDLANQRLPASILEDSINKPWRPIPSGRIAASTARRLLLYIIPAVLATTYFYLGGFPQAIAQAVLTWLYNDLAGADENFFIRNFLNALGLACYGSGSLTVIAGYPNWKQNERAPVWMAIIVAVITTTLHMADLPDMQGDAARGRSTLPLVYGETVARWSIAVPVVFWSVLCSWWWELTPWGYAAPVLISLIIAIRVLTSRNQKADKISYSLYCVWSMTLYLLPLCKNPAAVAEAWNEAFTGGKYLKLVVYRLARSLDASWKAAER